MANDFGSRKRFERLPDGTFYVRAGTQSNCGGIAGVHLRIESNHSGAITFHLSEDNGSNDDEYGSAICGSKVPTMFREAFFLGARRAFDERPRDIGLTFEIIDALVHVVDASVKKFEITGATAVTAWFDLNNDEAGAR